MTRTILPRFILSLCLALFCGPAALAQQLTIGQIAFQGTTPYSAASLQAASGLQIGQTVLQSDLDTATQQLFSTGAFSNVQSSVQGVSTSATITFTVAPIDPSHLLPVGFENFVWFQGQDLSTALQQLVPLYNGTISDAGNMEDAVAAALTQLLAAKGVTATVVKKLLPASPLIPQPVVEYFVASPAVVIRSINLSGTWPQFSTQTAASIQSLIGTRYNEGISSMSLTNILLEPYQDIGYLGSSLTPITRTIAASSSTEVDVNITATVTPGSVYSVSSVTWPGSNVLSAAVFNALTAIHPGDVASRYTLLQTLSNIDSTYRNNGYLDVAVSETPTLDPVAHTAGFAITATPGQQYTFASVTPVNLTGLAAISFTLRWLLQPGQIYSQGYVDSFIKSETALQGYSASVNTSPGTSSVALTLNY